MMTSRIHAGFAALVVLCSVVLAGCPQQSKDTGKSDTGTSAAPASVPEIAVARPALATGTEPATALARGESQPEIRTALLPGVGASDPGPFPDVFFAFDKATVGPEHHAALAGGIAWLLAHPEATITIEGHCDEHGTSEYNMSLGERRANAVRDYLVASGVSAERIRVLSYGEERPFAPEHEKRAWKLNRRAHFVVTGSTDPRPAGS